MAIQFAHNKNWGELKEGRCSVVEFERQPSMTNSALYIQEHRHEKEYLNPVSIQEPQSRSAENICGSPPPPLGDVHRSGLRKSIPYGSDCQRRGPEAQGGIGCAQHSPGGVAYLLGTVERLCRKHSIDRQHVCFGGEDCGGFADNFIYALNVAGHRVVGFNAKDAKSQRENY